MYYSVDVFLQNPLLLIILALYNCFVLLPFNFSKKTKQEKQFYDTELHFQVTYWIQKG